MFFLLPDRHRDARHIDSNERKKTINKRIFTKNTMHREIKVTAWIHACRIYYYGSRN